MARRSLHRSRNEPSAGRGPEELAFVPPCLAKAVSEPPAGAGWVHEIKHDGYRVQAHVVDGTARLLTRKGLDWTEKFGPVADEFASLPVAAAILDCEAIVADARGASDFPALVAAVNGETAKGAIECVAFDLLHLDGRDLRALPLCERKELLGALLDSKARDRRLHYGDGFAEDGATVLEHVARLGLEGIVSKRLDSPYRSGRSSGAWQKCKVTLADPFIIVGAVESQGIADGVGALLLAYRDGAGDLVYAGRVGTGMSNRQASEAWGALCGIRAEPPAFAGRLAKSQTKGVMWVEPRLVAQVVYRGVTADGLLRHASFKAFRMDKTPEDIGPPANWPTPD